MGDIGFRLPSEPHEGVSDDVRDLRRKLADRPPENDDERVVRVGVDVGQRVDPTAIVVCELERRRVPRHVSEAWPPPRFEYVPASWRVAYVVRHVERLPIGTTYPDVALRLVRLVDSLHRIMNDGRFVPHLLVDATGVGRPVVDLLRQALVGYAYRLTAATFTGTDKLVGGPRNDECSVGKAYLVSRLQSLLQTGKLKLPDTPEARQLAKEMLDYHLRVTDSAHLVAGAKTGSHDDLVTALGLSVLLGYRTVSPLMIAEPGDFDVRRGEGTSPPGGGWRGGSSGRW